MTGPTLADRRANAEALARAKHPEAEQIKATLYNGEIIVEVWRRVRSGRRARLYLLVGETL